jgi:very-short-patch-repair endonuclease
VQFYRQKNIGNYIVDFYCPQGRLVIELDGGQHYEKEGMKRDQERDSYLQALGLTVMRFSDIDALRNIDGVVERIYEHLKNPPQPSFSKGGNKTSISQRELQMQESSLPFLKGDSEGF